MVHVPGHNRNRNQTAVATVAVSVAIVTVARHRAVSRYAMSRHAVRQRAVARHGSVTGYPALRVMRVSVTVRVVHRSHAFLLFGNLLYGQETILPHLYPLGHISDGGVFCPVKNEIDI